MLVSLSITNYTLIDKLEINFKEGFSVITGETGAGKSIIIGALSLILGKRADLNTIRDKSKKCIIEGIFNNGELQLRDFFSQHDLDYESITIMRREILPSGKSRAFINDSPVNLSVLTELGNMFVNIHSQHQTLQLGDSIFQLNVLDSFIDNNDLLADYQEEYKSFNNLTTILKGLENKNTKALKDKDYFTFQFDELDNATLELSTYNKLEERAKYLEHAEEITNALSEAETILGGENAAVIDSLNNIEKTLGKITSYLPLVKDIATRIESTAIELKDVLSEIQSLNTDDDFDLMELNTINDKLNTINTLIHKHHVQSIEELILVRDDYEQKLLSIDSLDDEIKKLKSELAVIEESLKVKAHNLHNKRINGGKRFDIAITKVLQQLGMKDVRFETQVDSISKFSKSGTDNVLFMFSANHGLPLGEISKIASGGELSRLMLAIKSLINKKQILPTVIFDEIDSGVSGDIAGKVGVILNKMAQKHQVISISHLPQIAAKANSHYKVSKLTKSKSTISTIDLLSNDERVKEIAKMLSSEKVTETALGVARELLSS